MMPDQCGSEESEVRAILDPTAIGSFADGYVHVGELLVMIGEEGAYVGVPAAALLRAHADAVGLADQRARLAVLITLPSVRVLDLDVDVAEKASDFVGALGGDLALAQAAWAAIEHSAYFVTTDPEPVKKVVSPGFLHVIPTDDA
jgi:hypothetical protein